MQLPGPGGAGPSADVAVGRQVSEPLAWMLSGHYQKHPSLWTNSLPFSSPRASSNNTLEECPALPRASSEPRHWTTGASSYNVSPIAKLPATSLRWSHKPLEQEMPQEVSEAGLGPQPCEANTSSADLWPSWGLPIGYAHLWAHLEWAQTTL